MILKTLDITDRKDKNCLEIGNKVSKPYIRTSFLPGEFSGLGAGRGNLGRAQGTPGVKEMELESKETKAEGVCRAEHCPGEGYRDRFL